MQVKKEAVNKDLRTKGCLAHAELHLNTIMLNFLVHSYTVYCKSNNGIMQTRMGSLLNLVPFKISALFHLMKYFLSHSHLLLAH